MRFSLAVTILVVLLMTVCVIGSGHAEPVRIEGEYCYQYGDSESLMVAKEISYAMALRKAIETYRIFISSTSIVKDFKLKKDIVEAIASGYVDNIEILKQNVDGRTVCTAVAGYVDPQTVKSLISRKVERATKKKSRDFQGLISSENIKILNYKREVGKSRRGNSYPLHVSVLYQARVSPPCIHSTRIIVDCFDRDGNPIPGTSSEVPHHALSKGEVRREYLQLPDETAYFEIRLDDLY
ncbi:MAG: hypothetical protein JRJ38_16690 [Deltaproteobacteria bacterium]|nr:hypothetical protein [Deltaproteobacteria bacterium]